MLLIKYNAKLNGEFADFTEISRTRIKMSSINKRFKELALSTDVKKLFEIDDTGRVYTKNSGSDTTIYVEINISEKDAENLEKQIKMRNRLFEMFCTAITKYSGQ